MIQLIGPGGAGKTTIGLALASRLGLRPVDLDAEFTARYGDISVALDRHGDNAHATRNVGLYSDLIGGPVRPDVLALDAQLRGVAGRLSRRSLEGQNGRDRTWH